MVGCVVPNTAVSSEVISVFLGEVTDSKGRQKPIATDIEKLVNYVASETGLEFQIKILPWRRAQFFAKNAEGIIYGLSKSPERIELYDFSLPVVVEKVWAITADNGDAKIPTIHTLAGKTVSVERGVSHGFEFEKAKNTVFRVDEDTASVELRFKKLFAGRSDALLWQARQFELGKELKHYLINEVFINFVDRDLSKRKISVSTVPLYYDSIHFACAKGKYRAEIAKINTAIMKGKANGKLASILGGR
jgi:ABC-type amino acid transport substrate-binding protein